MLQQIFNYYITKSRMSGERENTILILTERFYISIRFHLEVRREKAGKLSQNTNTGIKNVIKDDEK